MIRKYLTFDFVKTAWVSLEFDYYLELELNLHTKQAHSVFSFQKRRLMRFQLLSSTMWDLVQCIVISRVYLVYTFKRCFQFLNNITGITIYFFIHVYLQTALITQNNIIITILTNGTQISDRWKYLFFFGFSLA